MPRYTVEVLRSFVTTRVVLEADGPSDAYRKVNNRGFPLPPVDEWEPLDGWEFVVYDDTECEVFRVD